MKLKNKKVGEIVKDNFKVSKVFQNYNIDFCCGGDITLIEACAKAGVDLNIVEEELLKINESLANEIDYKTMEPIELIAFIIKEHHKYVEEESKTLRELAEKVASVHGDKRKELKEIAHVVGLIIEDMLVHQQKEEQILFPYIQAMVESKKNNTPLPQTCFGSVLNPIRAMENDHDTVGAYIFRLKELTNEFKLPEDACASYATLFRRLEAFKENTFRHVHLENNILFKQAIELLQSHQAE